MSLLLAAALAQGDPSIDALVYLARHAERRDCGCAPARPGDSGRIVAAFFACGFSHLSGDTFAGQKFGDVLTRLLVGIEALQREDGLFFPDDPTANAWMAFALTEIWELTGEKRWEGPARLAAMAIQGMPGSDEDALFWQGLVLRSAFLGRLLPKGSELPPAPDLASPLAIAKADHRFVLAPGHVRKEHQAWRERRVAAWQAVQRKEGCGAGSWEGSVEATSYLATVMGRNCWPCRTFGRNVFGEK